MVARAGIVRVSEMAGIPALSKSVGSTKATGESVLGLVLWSLAILFFMILVNISLIIKISWARLACKIS